MKKYVPNEKTSHLTLQGYLGASVLYEGMKRAGGNLSRASLTSSLNSLGKFDIGDFEVNYSPEGKRGSNFVDMNSSLLTLQKRQNLPSLSYYSLQFPKSDSLLAPDRIALDAYQMNANATPLQ